MTQEEKKLEEKDFFDMLKPKKTINIAVSGRVTISEIEQNIIDTPAFQRLRGIRQLGAACQVYPTALHTRFDHSIGTLEMVKQMISKIRDNMHSEEEEKKIEAEEETLARLYALLHDITHVPFGHMLEDELGVFKRHDENTDRITFFLGETTDIGKLIVEKYGKEFYETFMQIYEWKESTKSKEDLDSKSPLKSKLVFIHDLVSNTACADLLDYLQRDNYFCNLDTRMSLNFLNYLYLKKENGKKRRVCVLLQKGNKPPKKDLITDLCRLLDDRYLIAERVYYHHAKIIAGTMLGRAIQEAIAEKEITEDNMLELSDDTLVDLLIKSKSTLVSKLAKAYKNRKLYRCLKNYSKNDIDKEMQKSKCPKDKIEKFLEDYRTDSNKRKKEIENTISAMTDTEDGDFLVYISDEQMNLKIAKMKVLCNDKIECFEDFYE